MRQSSHALRWAARHVEEEDGDEARTRSDLHVIEALRHKCISDLRQAGHGWSYPRSAHVNDDV